MEESLIISLYDPGMTNYHRVGLAGLYLSLKQLEREGREIEDGSWVLDETSVTLKWQGKAQPFFDALLKSSFGFDKDGLVDFAAHRGCRTGDAERVLIHQSLLGTFLNHNKQNKIPQGTPMVSKTVQMEGKSPVFSYRPLVRPYAHAQAAKDIFSRSGQKMKDAIPVKKWLLPGATQRHTLFGNTSLTESPSRYLCLVFAPMGCLYYRLSIRTKDGKWDNRRRTAVVIPTIENLKSYSEAFERYLVSPMESLVSSGLADAGLSALISLKAEESLEAIGVTGFSVITYGKVPWDKNQLPKTGFTEYEEIDDETLDRFALAWKCLGNRKVFTKETETEGAEIVKVFTESSAARGLVSENIAAGRPWYQGFSELMVSKAMAKKIYFEKEGLNEMVNEVEWDFEAEGRFVEAIHQAMRARFGRLYAQAKARGERPPFDREYERMRTGLLRAKNAQTLRAELADFFSRGGINSVLQESWKDILGVIGHSDWQKARDLALLGLASYKGKGAEEVEEGQEPQIIAGEEEQL